MSDVLSTTVVFLLSASVAAILCGALSRATSEPSELLGVRRPSAVGIGTVRTIDGPVTVDVEHLGSAQGAVDP
jgi:hypothetical protein